MRAIPLLVFLFLGVAIATEIRSADSLLRDIGTVTKASDCDSNAVADCAYGYTSCVSATTTLAAICNCYGQYGRCLYVAGCLSGSDGQDFINACESAGCSAQQCNFYSSSSTIVASIVLISVGVVVTLF